MFLLCLSKCSPPKPGSKDLFRTYESRKVVGPGRLENGSCHLYRHRAYMGPLKARVFQEKYFEGKNWSDFNPCLSSGYGNFHAVIGWFCAQGLVGFPAQGLDDFKLSSRSGVECEFFTLILGPMCLSLVLLSDLC